MMRYSVFKYYFGMTDITCLGSSMIIEYTLSCIFFVFIDSWLRQARRHAHTHTRTHVTHAHNEQTDVHRNFTPSIT